MELKNLTRRGFLGGVAAGVCGAGMARSAQAKGSKGRSRPNVVLMMADDLGYECLSCNGGLSYETPVLDHLAEANVRFEHCYSQPVCTPSRVKIMTGQYNFRNYISFECLRAGETTFGHIMQDAGYETCIAGKWQLSGSDDYPGTLPEDAGFDEYCLWQIHAADKGSRYWNPTLIQNGTKMEGLEGRYGPDVLYEFVSGFMKRNRRKPFFVYYPMVLPHGPHVPTPDSKEGDAKSKRDGKYFPDMVSYLDKNVGRVVAKIDELGLRENTLIIFIADNGTDKKIVSKMGARLIKGGKGTTPDAGTHVPMIVSWKGTAASGKVINELIDFSDFLPTIADVGDAKIPNGITVDGKSFLPLIKGQTEQTKEWVFCHYNKAKHKAAANKGKDTGNKSNKPEYTRFVRDKRYKLYSNGNFFDVPNDPEEKNPIQSAPEKRRRLQAILDSID